MDLLLFADFHKIPALPAAAVTSGAETRQMAGADEPVYHLVKRAVISNFKLRGILCVMRISTDRSF